MGGYGSANLASTTLTCFGQLVSIAGYYRIDDLSGMGAAAPPGERLQPRRHVPVLDRTRRCSSSTAPRTTR